MNKKITITKEKIEDELINAFAEEAKDVEKEISEVFGLIFALHGSFVIKKIISNLFPEAEEVLEA